MVQFGCIARWGGDKGSEIGGYPTGNCAWPQCSSLLQLGCVTRYGGSEESKFWFISYKVASCAWPQCSSMLQFCCVARLERSKVSKINLGEHIL